VYHVVIFQRTWRGKLTQGGGNSKMGSAQVTKITIDKTDTGAKLTVVVKGARPDFAQPSVLMDGRQVTLLLGPVDPKSRPEVKGDSSFVFASGIGSRFDPERRDEWGYAVNASPSGFLACNPGVTRDDSGDDLTTYYLTFDSQR
jgi:hypothetical protein